jgi:hypothetical protein
MIEEEQREHLAKLNKMEREMEEVIRYTVVTVHDMLKGTTSTGSLRNTNFTLKYRYFLSALDK